RLSSEKPTIFFSSLLSAAASSSSSNFPLRCANAAGSGANASSYFITGFRGSLTGGGSGVPNQAVLFGAAGAEPRCADADPIAETAIRNEMNFTDFSVPRHDIAVSCRTDAAHQRACARIDQDC